MAAAPDAQELELAERVADFYYSPYEFALFNWDWDSAPLDRYGGLDDWQVEFLQRLGEECLKRDRMDAGLVTEGEEDPTSRAVRMAAGTGHGPGKQVIDSTIVYTTSGTQTIGETKVGDRIFGHDGRLTAVTGVYPQGTSRLYRVTFSDGASVLAGEPHLWEVTTAADRDHMKQDGRIRRRVMSTGEMMGQLHRRFQIPMTEPVQFAEAEQFISPYLMGYYLGNGTSSNSCRSMRVSCFDCQALMRISKELKPGYSLNGRMRSYRHIAKAADHGGSENFYVSALDELGLRGKGAAEKFIPDLYKFASVEQRIALLQGLMDADGCISPRKGRRGWRTVFSTSSERLRDDMMWLVQSFGGTCGYCVDDRRGKVLGLGDKNVTTNLINYQLSINTPLWLNPFHIQRKAECYQEWLESGTKRKPIRAIESIKYECEAPATCLTVDNDRNLYLIDDFVVTHNTFLVAIIIIWFISTRANPQIIVTASTKQQLENKTWRELGKMKRLALNGHWFEHTATKFMLKSRPNLWYATAVPWSQSNSEAFAGTHEASVMVLFDESSGIDDIIAEVAEGAMTTPGSVFLKFGNRTKNTGHFSECWKRLRHRWITFEIDSRTSRVADQRQIKEWIDDFGIDSDFVRVRVLGKEPHLGAQQFIPANLVDQAVERIIKIEHIPRNVPRLMGADCAAGGDAKSVLVRRVGPKMLPDINRWNVPDPLALGGYFAEQINLWKPDIFFIDAYGIGLGTYYYLIQRGFDNIVPVYWGDRSLTIEKLVYYNPRIECYDRLRTWLRSADIPNDRDLIEDLIALQYMRDLQFIMRLERKEEMEKRGLPSPDTADALAITFFHATPEKTTAFRSEDLEPEVE